VSWLYFKRRVFNAERVLIALGIVPLSELWDKSREFNAVRPPIASGIVPPLRADIKSRWLQLAGLATQFSQS
tara:strand:- start:88 stop:303 length:216 start_codon:yes stop_codon:yes gene_type:complete